MKKIKKLNFYIFLFVILQNLHPSFLYAEKDKKHNSDGRFIGIGTNIIMPQISIERLTPSPQVRVFSSVTALNFLNNISFRIWLERDFLKYIDNLGFELQVPIFPPILLLSSGRFFYKPLRTKKLDIF